MVTSDMCRELKAEVGEQAAPGPSGMISSDILRELQEVCGNQNASTAQADLTGYFAGPPPAELMLVKPEDELEVPGVAKLATRDKIPIYSVRREPMEVHEGMSGGCSSTCRASGASRRLTGATS